MTKRAYILTSKEDMEKINNITEAQDNELSKIYLYVVGSYPESLKHYVKLKYDGRFGNIIHIPDTLDTSVDNSSNNNDGSNSVRGKIECGTDDGGVAEFGKPLSSTRAEIISLLSTYSTDMLYNFDEIYYSSGSLTAKILEDFNPQALTKRY